MAMIYEAMQRAKEQGHTLLFISYNYFVVSPRHIHACGKYHHWCKQEQIVGKRWIYWRYGVMRRARIVLNPF